MRSLTRTLLLFASCLLVFGCQSRDEASLEKALVESSRQRSQVATYLFSEIIKNHTQEDELRFEAMRGLSHVYLTQLFDYRRGVFWLEKIFDEYGKKVDFEERLRPLRVKASQVWRFHFESSERALDMMGPLITKDSLSLEAERELALVYLSQRNFDLAEQRYKRAWKIAFSEKDCLQTKSLQLEIMQNYALGNKCEESLSWAKQPLPGSCKPDLLALSFEKAHCYEMKGDISRAIQVYEDLVKIQPGQERARFFLEKLRKRREAQQKE